MMTSPSPMFAQPARLNASPQGSPTLRPAQGVMDHDERAPRSTNRRPYCSPRMSRSRSRPRGGVDAATTQFAEAVIEIIRARKARAAELGISPTSPGGHANTQIVEIIVDVPVWSVGCFADLSTLHALRDNTLNHVHSLLYQLSEAHAVHATYKLLAKRPCCVGWGAIRIAPSALDGPGASRPARRTSFVQPEREGTGGVASPPRRLSDNSPTTMYEHTFHDSDSEYSVVGTGIHDCAEDEEEAQAMAVVKDEVERRKEREGACFMLAVKGRPHLIVV